MRIPCAMCGKLLRNEKALMKHTNRCKENKNRVVKGSIGKVVRLSEINTTVCEPQPARHSYNYTCQLLTGNRHYNTGFISNKNIKNKGAV